MSKKYSLTKNQYMDRDTLLYSTTLDLLTLLSLLKVFAFPKDFDHAMDLGDDVSAFVKRMIEKEDHDEK